VPAFLTRDLDVRQAHGLEGLARELTLLALDLLHAQDVGGLLIDEAGGLLGAQADAHETQLSSLFGAAIEEATLARRMMGMEEFRDDPDFASVLRTRIELVERETAEVADWLHVTAGLVRPEPG